uniref:Uncharacterized protein n=1 Tax=Caenorhabditis japonica TaxID=281687 RepID=A0A8R1HII7_CAEJA
MYNASSTVLKMGYFCFFRGISALLQAEASGIQYMLKFDDWCKTLSTRVLRQTSKRVEKQDTWLVCEDDRKIHQQVRKADYYAHVYSSPETNRRNLYHSSLGLA